jgi:putative addiction module component (TIGR02574 family)
VTLAAVKKLAMKLPSRQRLQLADTLYDSLPSREPTPIDELERRADEVISGKVKPIPGDVFLAGLRRTIRQLAHKRSRQRGKRPGAAISSTSGVPSGKT